MEGQLTQTQKQYDSAYRVLTKMTGKKIEDILTTPEDTYKCMTTHEYKEGKNYDIKSVKNFLTAIMKYYKVIGDGVITQEHLPDYLKYLSYFNGVKANIQTFYNTNQPTERQREGLIPWCDVIKKRDELSTTEYGSRRHLLLSMYSYIPPLRQDFNEVRIYGRTPKNAEGNYIVINRQTRKLFLNEYKTATHYGKYEIDLPVELVKVIEASIKKTPREYLFTDLNEGKPYSSSSFTWFSNHTLKEVLDNRKVSVSMLRHSYISGQDYNKLSEADKQTIARQMCHSVHEQSMYRKI